METDNWNSKQDKKKILGMFVGRQSVKNLIMFALLKDRTEEKFMW